MKRKTRQQSYYFVIQHQATLMVHDAQESISNEQDLERLKLQMETIDASYKELSKS
ncbi:hypothetical protein [Nonlabens sp. MB-3u-79]|uniref:hypothetical protein n=1 Tax=Nonlabens sp. MB-3u-79 TaxID=2058134 RepID=UPI0012FD5DD0|nr:hypothetical protein [Nonlabens sp. MB-3u-79]